MKIVKKPKAANKLKGNSFGNIDGGSKICPILNEARNIGEGIVKEDLSKVVQNVGLLAMYTLSGSAEPIKTSLKSNINGASKVVLAS